MLRIVVSKFDFIFNCNKIHNKKHVDNPYLLTTQLPRPRQIDVEFTVRETRFTCLTRPNRALCANHSGRGNLGIRIDCTMTINL